MVHERLHALQLPDAALNWLAMLFDATQTLDDYADGDEVPREALDKLIWNALAAMPTNPFFLANAQVLGGAIATAIMKWQASDMAERNGRANARSFGWRASFFDVLMQVVILCKGPYEAQMLAESIMNMPDESLEAYLKEFENA